MSLKAIFDESEREVLSRPIGMIPSWLIKVLGGEAAVRKERERILARNTKKRFCILCEYRVPLVCTKRTRDHGIKIAIFKCTGCGRYLLESLSGHFAQSPNLKVISKGMVRTLMGKS